MLKLAENKSQQWIVDVNRYATGQTFYRPICLLDIMEKLLERLVTDRVRKDLEERETKLVLEKLLLPQAKGQRRNG